VSPDRRYTTIGMAGGVTVDGDDKTLVMIQPMKGTHAAVPRIQKLLDERDIVDVAITSGAARALEPDLVKAGITYTKMSTTDMAASYATLQEAIKGATVVHVGQLELDNALSMARTRYWMTGEAEVFDRRGYSADVSPAVAVAGALYRWGLQEAPMPMLL
jgi:metal-dependent amidase/aminoacylase/carboxypeptidase family protein